MLTTTIDGSDFEMVFLGRGHLSHASEGNNVCSLEQDEGSECLDLFRALSTVVLGQQMCNRTKTRHLSLHSSISSVQHCDFGQTKVLTLYSLPNATFHPRTLYLRSHGGHNPTAVNISSPHSLTYLRD